RAGPAQADPPGTGELLDAVGAHELLEGVELLWPADDLERDRIAADVGDARAEDLAERDQLGALVRRGTDRGQRRLALDRLAGRQLDHPEDVDELVHLLLDLLERVLRAVDAQGQAGDVRALRGPDREALDVVAAPGEHLGYARERTGLVLELDGDGVLAHLRTPARALPRPRRAAR